ncbi:RNA-directed DNA polymerase from mobile element jockey-like [Elysia marginata]|uniref:RNA-directed DNA polymerase from mobile element jockey-like n=1 Tax=Elysia marginata TaxID=1093978 RepID=A0AAV4EE95_9GAST|nr:RNA-directed DNA polymerase from mobile element jockey-like [Elysia marginata]
MKPPPPPIMEEEVRNAIRKLNRNKATGPDEIPVELFDALNETCLVHFTELLNLICDTGQWPSDLKKSVFRTLQKKPGETECENHRTISLMSHTTKMLLRIVMTRIRSKIRPEIAESQFGFVPYKGTQNAIFTLSMLMERVVEVQDDVYLCFIDYSKNFDKVKHSEFF